MLQIIVLKLNKNVSYIPQAIVKKKHCVYQWITTTTTYHYNNMIAKVLRLYKNSFIVLTLDNEEL